ncbi:phage tail protein [Desulfonema magnum]|uniref:Phage tail protein n=1 Tax=Desulfonema magnum TaxID=45655 RepID=A0A975BP36_9BACT|nr:phage tail protein [Desulfonema magnum]QTA89107.1 Phage tail protein [Desulfonema magnum]
MARTLVLDPYKNYRFKVYFGEGSSDAVAGVTNVSALSRSIEAISFRDGGGDSVPSSCPSPGLASFEPLTLSRGMTKDGTFHAWAMALDPVNGYDESEGNANIRKDITIELCNDKGDTVLKYRVYDCWVSQYQALPDLNSTDNAIAIQTLTIQHEGFQRETE